MQVLNSTKKDEVTTIIGRNVIDKKKVVIKRIDCKVLNISEFTEEFQ